MDTQHSDKKAIREGNKASGARSVRKIMLRVALITFSMLVVLSIAAALFAANYWSRLHDTTPSPERLLQARSAEPSILMSASGTHLATFNRGHFKRVTLDEVSPHVIQALVAVEDHRFYEHNGVDIARSIGAAWYTLRGSPQGGSTITQQLVRNLFPNQIGRARTLERKLREMVTAVKLEQAYSKEEILETYLNSVPFLYQVIGIEMAARTYYDKSAADLDLIESATLVGMLKGTSYYNPILHPKRAEHRRNVVLLQMVRHGMLDSNAYQKLRAQPLQAALTRQPDPLGKAPHFAAHVKRQLIAWADANDYNIYTDGLVVHSTLDDRLQAVAEAAVARQSEVLQNIADVEWSQRDDRVASRTPAAYAKLRKKVDPFSQFWAERPGLLQVFVRESPEFRRAVQAGATEEEALERLSDNEDFIKRLRARKTRLEAGFVAVNPETGAVKAWIGSRDFASDQFDHVAQAVRQPGSTFKPFVYGAAMEHGLQPELLYPDGKVEIRLADGGVWRPTDMSGYSGRMMSMREGLVFSKNTITAQVSQDVGLEQVADMARAAGIRSSQLRAVPSLALGTSPVTLLEMVSAYSTIAQVGAYRQPLTINRITDRDGKVLAEFNAEPEYVMSEDTAVELIDMLRGVVRQGTGAEIRNRFKITADIAGKTGTTQYNTDGWFILMHPQLVAGAWVGFNDQRVTMRSDYWGQGGHNAVLVVGDFFRDTLKSELLDANARFPESRRPPPLMVRAPVEDDRLLVQGIDLIPPPGHGIVTSEERDTAVVVTPDGMQEVPRADAQGLAAGRVYEGLGPGNTVRGPREGAQARTQGQPGTPDTERAIGDSGAIDGSSAAGPGIGAQAPSPVPEPPQPLIPSRPARQPSAQTWNGETYRGHIER